MKNVMEFPARHASEAMKVRYGRLPEPAPSIGWRNGR